MLAPEPEEDQPFFLSSLSFFLKETRRVCVCVFPIPDDPPHKKRHGAALFFISFANDFYFFSPFISVCVWDGKREKSRIPWQRCCVCLCSLPLLK
jgi:hypothetical protein